MPETYEKRHRTIPVKAITGQPYQVDITHELELLFAVVAQARREARSECSHLKYPARSFLKAIGLPVDGPAMMRMTKRRDGLAVNEDT